MFNLGKLVMTPRIAEEVTPYWLQRCLTRHMRGDWGLVDDDDKAANNAALKNGARILSSYYKAEGIDKDSFREIWIITEADRSSTTIMYPDEY